MNNMNVLEFVLVITVGIVVVVAGVDIGSQVLSDRLRKEKAKNDNWLPKLWWPSRTKKETKPVFDMDKVIELGIAQYRRTKRIELGLIVIRRPVHSHGSHRRVA